MKIKLKIALIFLLPLLLLISTQKASAKEKCVEVLFHYPLDFVKKHNIRFNPSRSMKFSDQMDLQDVFNEIKTIENIENSNPVEYHYPEITGNYRFYFINNAHNKLIPIKNYHCRLADLSRSYNMLFLAIPTDVLSQIRLNSEEQNQIKQDTFDLANETIDQSETGETDSDTAFSLSPRGLDFRVKVLIPENHKLVCTSEFNPFQKTAQELLEEVLHDLNLPDNGDYCLIGQNKEILNNSSVLSFYNVCPDDTIILIKVHPEVKQETWQLINDHSLFKEEAGRLTKLINDAENRLKDRRLARLEQQVRSSRKYDQKKLKLFEQQDQNKRQIRFPTRIPTTSKLSDAPLPAFLF